MRDTFKFPPNISKIVQGRLMELREGTSLTMRYEVKSDYDNPIHRTFGGVYALFFDATFGPFSTIITGSMTTSLDLNITFIRSLSVADEYVDIEARVVSLSKSFLVLTGQAYNKNGDVVATCQSRMMILDHTRHS